MIKNLNNIIFKSKKIENGKKSLSLILLLFLIVLNSNKAFSQNYAAEVISVNYGSSEWCIGESRNVSITVKNTGTRTWYATGTTAPCTNTNLKVAVSFKWNADPGFDSYNFAPFSNRNPIPSNVAPGSSVTIIFPVRTPLGDPIGTNNLSFNLIAQECVWFTPIYTSPNITINAALNPGTISNAQSICHGQVPAKLIGTSPTGGDGTYTYQWEKQTNCSGAWTNASGINTSADYQPAVLTESTCYRRRVNSSCGVAYTKPVTISTDLKLHFSFDKQSEPTSNLIPFSVATFNSFAEWNCTDDNPANVSRVLFTTLGYQGRGATTITKTAIATDGYFQVSLVSGFPISFTAGSTFTASVKYKRQDLATNFSIGDWGGPDGNNNVWNFVSDEEIEDGWRLRVVQFTYLNAGSPGFTFGINSTTHDKWITFSDFQLEKKEHATPFFAGTINSAPVLDLSGNGYHGIIKNTTAPKWISNGIDGGAYEFNGGDFIEFPNPGLSNVNQEWTVAAWVKVSDLNQNAQFLVQGMNRGNYVYYLNKKQPLLYLNGGVNDYYTYGSSSIVANTWHQIVFVFRNSDGLRKIYLDGVNISTAGPNFTSTPFGLLSTFKLGTNFKGGIDELRIYGKAFTDQDVKDFYEAKSLKIKLPTKSNVLATNGQTATCEVKGLDWIHFHEPVTGNLIGSVNANGGDLGSVTLKAGVNSGGAMYACNTASAPQFYTAYMGRNWHVNSSAYASSAPISPNPSIRLPYAGVELTAMNAIASGTTTGNPLDNGATAAQVMLTKISGGSVDGNPTNDCSATILGISQSSSGTIMSSYTDLTISGSYADFTVGQFSEMFLNKNFNTSPLPVKLTNFSATCNKGVILTWTTASEQNSDRFIVEKSRDGQTWNLVAAQTAAGTSNTILNYTQTDENNWNGVTYYRLRQIDFNGAEEIYGPISTSCGETESSIIVYPNPNNGSFTIEIASTEMYNNAQLFLTDLTGKVITSQSVNVANGTTQILIDNLDLKMGTYLVTLRGADQQLKPVKLVVTK